MTDTTMLDAALDLAAQGWAVLPCHEVGERAKAPYLLHGFHEASRDPETIRGWWARWPAAMIGAAVPATLVALDIDPRAGGSLDRLEQLLGPLPATLTTTSGRGDGGRHLYYMRPHGKIAGSALKRIGVDLKKSGYCVMPPSLHPATGRPYTWNDELPVRLPSRAVSALRPAQPRPKPVLMPAAGDRFAGLVRTVARAQVESRNDTLYWATCRAVEDGAPDAVFNDLAAAARATGLGELEVSRTIESARSPAREVRS